MTKIFLTIALLLAATPVLAGSGVQGRVAWRGELVPQVRVSAYRQIADIASGDAAAVSAPSALDGTYRLELPVGRYFLVARSFTGTPQPGDYFCYYSGAPVTVSAGRYTNVGFNLIKVPAEEPPQAASGAGLRGSISYQGEPLERAYLYVYKDADDGFKGPGYFIQPVERGSFRLRLPPGEYYLLVRKRSKGGRFGPIETGDYFNYYYGNPVRIEAGTMRHVEIEAITRLSMLEEEQGLPFRGVRGKVVDPSGTPLAGVYVFAYHSAEMTGTPAHFSAPSGAEGGFELPLPDEGPYYLLARQAFGGPAGEGEYYGRFGGASDHAIVLRADKPVREVTIHVDKKSSP